MNMKKVFLLAAVTLLAASCLKSKYESTFPLLVSFEGYVDSELYPKGEEAFFRNQFFYGDLDFFNTRDTVKVNGKDSVRFQGGFAIAYKCDTLLEERTSPYSIFSAFDRETLKAQRTNHFAVIYDNPDKTKNPKYPMTFPFYSYGSATLSKCFVCNTTLVVASVLGYTDLEPFTDGDWLRLTLTGWRKDAAGGNDVETGKITLYLADYREGKRMCLKQWAEVDISALGSIHYMTYAIESSTGEIPPYVCFDDMAVSIALKQ